MTSETLPSAVPHIGPVDAHDKSSSTMGNDASPRPHHWEKRSGGARQSLGSVSMDEKGERNVQETTIATPRPFHRRTHDFRILPIPRKQQYDPSGVFNFTLRLNVVFGISSTAITANLYYCQPLLVNLANSFNTTDSTVSTIPTVTQAGYALGILLISPLGDLIRRRPLILLMLSLSLLLTIGIALAPSIPAFKALSFLTGVCTVTPQILIPYAVDLAPPHRRASVMSIVLSGLLLGVIVARAIGGVVADISGSWRNVYWMGCGLQGLSLLSLWWVVPDRPSKTEWEMEPALEGRDSQAASTATVGNIGPVQMSRLTYLGILKTMFKFAATEPILIQGYTIGFLTQIIFASFWVTLTFLLTNAPYHFSTLDIGLFGLIGIVGVTTAPFVGHLVDKLVLWVGMLLAISIIVVSVIILTIGAAINIAAVIIVCIGLDLGVQLGHVSTTSKIYEIDPAYRSRLNAVYVVASFLGQLIGSAVGSKIFLSYGWRASAGASIGFGGLMLVVMLARGPHCKRYTWFGWEGGARFVKDRQAVASDEEKGASTDVAARVDEEKIEALDS